MLDYLVMICCLLSILHRSHTSFCSGILNVGGNILTGITQVIVANNAFAVADDYFTIIDRIFKTVRNDCFYQTNMTIYSYREYL